MSTLDEAVAGCKGTGTKMPPQYAAWLVARELEGQTMDQAVLGQALFDLLGGPGPPELAAIITRMVHPDTDRRWPADGRELREALYGYASSSGRPVTAQLVREFIAKLQGLPRRDSGEWLSTGPAIDAVGRVSAKAGAREARVGDFAPPEAPEEQLELARAPRQPVTEWQEPAPYREEVAPRRGRGPILAVVALLIIAGGVAGAFMFLPTLQRRLPFNLTPAARALFITSEPDGATVLIEGQTVGSTPFASDNRWRGRARIEIRKEGYETFKDTFEGGKDQSISAALRKKR